MSSRSFGANSDACTDNRWPFHSHHLLWTFSGQQENENVNRDVLQPFPTSSLFSSRGRQNVDSFEHNSKILISSTEVTPGDNYNIFDYSDLLVRNLTPNLLEESNNATQQSASAVEDDIEFYYFYKTEQLTFLWIIFVMIVFGNCSVLAALVTSKNRKTRMNFFIMHLAIADLMVGLINVLTDIVWRTTVGFYAGNIACKVVKFLQVLVTYSSTYVLVSLSIDRYDAITHPLNFSGSWKRAKILVATAWGLSSLFSIPAIFLNEEEMVKGHPQCWINLKPWQWQLYITLVALSLFFIPAVVIASCYSIIVHTIWNKSRMTSFAKSASKYQSKKQSNVKHSQSFENSVSTGLEEESVCERSSSRGVIPRAKIKTIKMTFVIVFVFILCWSPYFVWDLLQVYGFIPNTQTTIALSTFIQSLAPLNSAANPMIYCLFSTRIIRNLRKRPVCTWIVNTFCCCIPRLQRAYGRDAFHSEFAGTLTTQTYSSRTTSTAHNRDVSLTCRPTCVDKNSKPKPLFANETNFECKGA